MFFLRPSVNYALVGERDGCAGREPAPRLWRKTDYRSGYACGLLERARRIAGAEPQANSTRGQPPEEDHADVV
jgi:hypothetical protein